jgi:hypothetical protein
MKMAQSYHFSRGEGNTKGKFEIGRILHLKFEIRNRRLDCRSTGPSVQFPISDFEFEMQDSSNFSNLFLQALVPGDVVTVGVFRA